MRYFIALMLRGEDKERVERLRLNISKDFGVTGALKIPPHVTLVRPFESVATVDIIADAIADAADSFETQLITATEFAAFEKAVWFINLEQRKRLFDLKTELERRLRQSIAWIPEQYDKDIHFHLTLAYRDVTSDIHDRIGAFLKTQKLPIKKIPFDSFSLLKHDGLRWQEIERFSFSK